MANVRDVNFSPFGAFNARSVPHAKWLLSADTSEQVFAEAVNWV